MGDERGEQAVDVGGGVVVGVWWHGDGKEGKEDIGGTGDVRLGC